MLEDDPALRETLKRCSPDTYYAACKFRHSGRREDLDPVILGIIARYAERDLRPKILAGDAALRLREDLAIDSLTMMEIVMIVEEVLRISVANEELTHLRTLGDVQQFIEAKLAAPPARPLTAKEEADTDPWNLAVVGEDIRRLEKNATVSLPPFAK